MNELRLNQLRYFCEVCDTGSVTKAANNLHITQPSISAAVKSLENAYALALFYREKNRLTLTREGAFLYERARSILSRRTIWTPSSGGWGCRGIPSGSGYPP